MLQVAKGGGATPTWVSLSFYQDTSLGSQKKDTSLVFKMVQEDQIRSVAREDGQGLVVQRY
jgi:hypothetical protein